MDTAAVGRAGRAMYGESPGVGAVGGKRSVRDRCRVVTGAAEKDETGCAVDSFFVRIPFFRVT